MQDIDNMKRAEWPDGLLPYLKGELRFGLATPVERRRTNYALAELARAKIVEKNLEIMTSEKEGGMESLLPVGISDAYLYGNASEDAKKALRESVTEYNKRSGGRIKNSAFNVVSGGRQR